MGGNGHDHHHHSPEAMPKADQDLEALRKHDVPLVYRDHCAHLLIKLNECRYENYFMPFKCVHERHIHQECEYIAYTRRVEAKQRRVAEAKAAAEAAAAAKAEA